MQAAVSEQFGIDATALREVCQRFDVRWLALFGSVARGEATPDSDVDVLYELRPGRAMGYIEFGRLADALSQTLGGRHVDLARPSQIHWYYRDDVLSEMKVVYEE